MILAHIRATLLAWHPGPAARTRVITVTRTVPWLIWMVFTYPSLIIADVAGHANPTKKPAASFPARAQIKMLPHKGVIWFYCQGASHA
jgi:hypothetical protein